MSRVLWLSHFVPYPPKGGMLLRAYNLLRQLAKEFNVDLIALRREDTLRGMYADPKIGFREAEAALSDICTHVEFVETQIGRSNLTNNLVALRSLLPGPPYTVRWVSSRHFTDRKFKGPFVAGSEVGWGTR